MVVHQLALKLSFPLQSLAGILLAVLPVVLRQVLVFSVHRVFSVAFVNV